MKTVLTILLFVGLYQSSWGCCAEDDRTLTEMLFQGKAETIFSCKVLTFWKPANNDDIIVSNSTKSIEGTATAEIITVYFGKVDTNIITLRAGSNLTVGLTYLIYTRGSGKIFGFGGICDRWTKQVTDNPSTKNELLILKKFSDIFKNKTSGQFTFTNSEDIVIAKGQFNEGKAIKIWQHFYDNGIIKAEFDINNNSTSQFYSNGFIKTRQVIKQHTSIYETYCDKLKDEMTLRLVEVKDSVGKLITSTWWEYNHEHYADGKIKFTGLTSHGNRVGIWKWFSDKGELTAEYDYKSGPAEQ